MHGCISCMIWLNLIIFINKAAVFAFPLRAALPSALVWLLAGVAFAWSSARKAKLNLWAVKISRMSRLSALSSSL